MSDGPASPATRLEETERYLQTLTEDAPPGSLLDVRYRTEDGFGRFFKDTDDPATARTIAQIGEETDVYVGVAPRERHSGRREDVASTQLLWADCDTPESVQALDEFPLTPTMTVRSGSGEPEHENTHAYWALTEPLSTEALEDTNRRLADALGADRKCADAARILRPAGTNNFKHDLPHPVKLAEHTDNHYTTPRKYSTRCHQGLRHPNHQHKTRSPHPSHANPNTATTRPAATIRCTRSHQTTTFASSPARSPAPTAKLIASFTPMMTPASTSTLPPSKDGRATAVPHPTENRRRRHLQLRLKTMGHTHPRPRLPPTTRPPRRHIRHRAMKNKAAHC
jgi:hypothetical protein